MKKVIFHKPQGIAVLSLAADGQWDINLGGKNAPKNYSYDLEQIKRLIAIAREKGEVVEIE